MRAECRKISGKDFSGYREKTFAANAATAGGMPSLATGAKQVIQSVDRLPTMQQNSDNEAVVKRVGQFAEVFNAVLTQVQEIRK